MHTFGHTANTKYIFASALTEGSANEMTWEKHLTIPIVIADDTKVTQALLHLLASRPTSPADEETLLSESASPGLGPKQLNVQGECP